MTFVERLFAADWPATARILVATTLVLLGASCAMTSFELMTVPLTNFGFRLSLHPSGVAHFLHDVMLNAAMAFGSPQFLNTPKGRNSVGIGAAPLTVTLLTLFVMWLCCRRDLRSGPARERLLGAARVSVLFALIVMTISLFASDQQGGLHIKQEASPVRAFGWSLLFGLVVSAIAVLDLETVGSRLGERAQRFWKASLLPVRGAAVALSVGIGAGALCAIAGGFANHGTVGLPAKQLARGIPLAFGYFVNLGVVTLGIASGSAWRNSLVPHHHPTVSLSYAHRHGLPPEYFLVLLLPVVAIAAGAVYIAKRRGELDDRQVVRACYRMSIPFALMWLVLAIPSRVHGTVTRRAGLPEISGHMGPEVLLGSVILLGWGVVLGYVMGEVVSRVVRVAPSARASRFRLPGWVGWSACGLVAIVGAVVAAVIVHGGPKGSVFLQ